MSIRTWLPAALWLAFIALIIALADTHHARWLFTWIEHHTGSDKAGHFVLIGGMAFFANLALRGRTFPLFGWRWLVGSAAVALIFTAEEISQKFNRYRHFDYGDLAADFAGILVFGWLARRALRLRPASKEIPVAGLEPAREKPPKGF